MFIVMNRFQVTKGREQDFMDAFRGRAGLVESMHGFRGLEMLRPDAEGVFVSLTRWATKADFDNWVSSDAFREAHKRRHEGMFVTHPHVEMYHVFDSSDGNQESNHGA